MQEFLAGGEGEIRLLQLLPAGWGGAGSGAGWWGGVERRGGASISP